ncbi:hypothetical protein B4092_2725 [Bacillus licheniformis]|nr:hypothetical protein B4092_2725 [Bacillus licheniformis]
MTECQAQSRQKNEPAYHHLQSSGNIRSFLPFILTDFAEKSTFKLI